MTTTTKALAQWISGLRRDDVPEGVRRALRLLAMDTFACAMVGGAQPWTQAIRSWALAPGSGLQGGGRGFGESPQDDCERPTPPW
ncbi:MmgE/PrpD family protein [Achromobacter xylosoxidans]|uniref:MmgE/PrpD family protein n=1 Tax=Alcaligenes xylosoxydans xylosoxydans TaxID=85698 RepID=UPI00069F70D4